MAIPVILPVLPAIAVCRSFVQALLLPPSVKLAAQLAAAASMTVITAALPFGCIPQIERRGEMEGVSGLTRILQGSGGTCRSKGTPPVQLNPDSSGARSCPAQGQGTDAELDMQGGFTAVSGNASGMDVPT